MADWRLARGWTEPELEERLRVADPLPLNFADPIDSMSRETGWNQYYSEAVLAREPPGPPLERGPYAIGRVAVAGYQFSDPRIVIGHFRPDAPLLGRTMLLELIALRVLHFLTAVRIGATRDTSDEKETVFGFRYDTLEGHVEQGAEWFLLTKDHETGEIRFRIDAFWRPGQFPNWWSRLGFALVGQSYQRTWHHRAHARLAVMMRAEQEVPPGTESPGRLAHTGPPEVTFRRIPAS